jgi:hypothetical protein
MDEAVIIYASATDTEAIIHGRVCVTYAVGQ